MAFHLSEPLNGLESSVGLYTLSSNFYCTLLILQKMFGLQEERDLQWSSRRSVHLWRGPRTDRVQQHLWQRTGRHPDPDQQ